MKCCSQNKNWQKGRTKEKKKRAEISFGTNASKWIKRVCLSFVTFTEHVFLTWSCNLQNIWRFSCVEKTNRSIVSKRAWEHLFGTTCALLVNNNKNGHGSRGNMDTDSGLSTFSPFLSFSSLLLLGRGFCSPFLLGLGALPVNSTLRKTYNKRTWERRIRHVEHSMRKHSESFGYKKN